MLSLIKFSESYLISFVLIVSVVCGQEWESATGCPKGNPSNGELYLKHYGDGQCYKVNSRGPCGRNMIFIPYPSIIILSSNAHPDYARSDSRRPSKSYGFCDCFDAVKETEEEIEFIKNYSTDCILGKRTQIYVPQRKRCYSAFHQGPCNPGKWLVLNSTYHPICTKNLCIDRSSHPSEANQLSSRNSEYSPKFMFTYNKTGPCYETTTQGFCPKHHILRPSKNHWLPTCSFLRQNRGSSKCMINKNVIRNEIPISHCKPGSRIGFLTGCSWSINPR